MISIEGLSFAQNTKELNIIPAPANVDYKNGHFNFNNKVQIVVLSTDKEIQAIAIYCKNQIRILNNIDLPVDTSVKKDKNSILLKTGYTAANKEAYSITVNKKQIIINGAGPAGLFYGVQSLLQLIYPSQVNGSEVRIPSMEIYDAPNFAWRGMHLDVCRHFFPVSFIKTMIDMLALHKMNILHWHLTDDQGWRIEIKKYPKLTAIGGFRDETMKGHYPEDENKFDGIRYGGFYTQDEIKEVVNYAKTRYVTIVPEIEMPGHSVAALSAYPEFSCTGGPFKVYTRWGISEDVFCPGKDETFKFLEYILDEVIDLFPGPYIHVGGDECPKTRWKACPYCQKRIKDEGLKDETALQSYFVGRIESYLSSKGKTLIGWDEIADGDIPARAIIMSWRGSNGGIVAANAGHDVIMTPGDYCYFDQYQSLKKEPLAIGGLLPLDKVYSFNPIPLTLPVPGRYHIIGAQANVWTEYISDEQHAEYMIFPRLCAMAEVLWTPALKHNYNSFLNRLPYHLRRLQKYNVNYHPLKD